MYTLEQYRKLKDAIASGALSVEYTDRKVTFRSLNEMKQTLRMMEAELGLNSKRPSRIKYNYEKGL